MRSLELQEYLTLPSVLPAVLITRGNLGTELDLREFLGLLVNARKKRLREIHAVQEDLSQRNH